MRVAIDAHMVGSHETGNEVYIVNLVRGLQQIDSPDHEFLLLRTPTSESPLDQNLPTKQFSLSAPLPENSVLRIPWSMPRLVFKEKIDVLFVTYNAPPILPKTSLVVLVHDLGFKKYPQYYSPKVRWMLSSLVPLSVRKANQVIVPTEFIKRQIIEEYNVPENKVVVSLEAASPDFRPIGDESLLSTVQEKYGVAQPFVMAVGNLEPRKNLLRLVRAFAEVVIKREVAARLVIVGKMHWQGSAVYAEIQRLDIQNHVILTGFVPQEDLVALYNLATVFAYPSLYEGFGLPILEAMACGTPVITSNAASMPEVAGDAALLVDPYSEAELATALYRILTDCTLREYLREQGLRQAARFNWERTARFTLQACEAACCQG